MVRLPRGLLLLAAVVVVGLLALAYALGYGRGVRHIESQVGSGLVGAVGPVGGVPTPIGVAPEARSGFTSANAVSSHAPGPTPPQAVAPTGAVVLRTGGPERDGRQQGLNYFVANLVGARESDARRIVEFFWQEGVEVQAVRLHNRGLFQVIALRGFRREELNTQPYAQYEQALKRVARLWKAQNPSSWDLTGMYADRYAGQAVELVIYRESLP